MRIFGVVGWKNNGKTTLVVKLVEHYVACGLKVATVKHAHHRVDIDQPGKDSWRHRQAGACEVVLATSRRWALIHELAANEAEPPLDSLLDRLSPCDLAIVEGFKAFGHPKIEVHLAARGTPLLAASDKSVMAVASDTMPVTRLPVIHLDDIARIADFMLERAATPEQVALP